MVKPKKQRLSENPHPRKDCANAAPAACTRPPCSSDPPSTTFNVPHISDFPDLTFEEYKAFGFGNAQQRELIGEIRAEIPLVDAHQVDNWILDSLAKQLSVCIFPLAKMMHINPTIVKRMLDTEFRKAYGQDVEASTLEVERQ